MREGLWVIGTPMTRYLKVKRMDETGACLLLTHTYEGEKEVALPRSVAFTFALTVAERAAAGRAADIPGAART